MSYIRKTIFAVIAIAAVAGSAYSASAAPTCSVAPNAKKMTSAVVSKMFKNEGYKVKSVRMSGNCYRMIGTNHKGKPVALYLDPVTGKTLK